MLGGTNSWWVVNKISCKMVHIFDIGLDVQLGWRVFMVWWFSACISWPLTISGSCHRRPLLQRNQLGSKLRLPQRRLLGKHQSPARRNDMQARRIFMFHLWKFWNMKIEGRHGGFLLLIGISLPVGLWWLWRSPVWGSLRRNSHVSRVYKQMKLIHRCIQTSKRHEGCAYAKPSMRRECHSKGSDNVFATPCYSTRLTQAYPWLFIQRSTDLTWSRV